MSASFHFITKNQMTNRFLVTLDQMKQALGKIELLVDFLSLKTNGILLPKLFWPTVRKNCLVIEKNFLGGGI